MRTAHTPPGLEPVEQGAADATGRSTGFAESLRFAAFGIARAYGRERNLRIQSALGCAALSLGCLLDLTAAELALVAGTCALVLGAELVNTAIEAAVDLCTREFHPLAGLAKDVAAGAVLLASFFSVVVGALLFVPRLWPLQLRPGGTPWALGVLVLGAALHILLRKISLAFPSGRD
ncbi:MAG: diacylglycerol kinase family protein [Pseudomonadota bacterium]|nr:MAG: hypothetical protein DIU72_01540 [Pseudomonadota bacterium]